MAVVLITGCSTGIGFHAALSFARRGDPTYASIRKLAKATYTEDETPPAARTCGAAACVNEDELTPRVIRRLWEAAGDPVWTGLPG